MVNDLGLGRGHDLVHAVVDPIRVSPVVQVWRAASGWTASRRRRARSCGTARGGSGPRRVTGRSAACRRTAGTSPASRAPAATHVDTATVRRCSELDAISTPASSLLE